MILSKITVDYFRCIENCVVPLDPYVAIIGPNGVGKSTILEAIRFLLNPDAKLTLADYNVEAPDMPIKVTGYFINLTEAEILVWKHLLDSNNCLELNKIAQRDSANTILTNYSGTSLRFPAFVDLHNSFSENKTEFRSRFKTFRKMNPQFGLEDANKSDEMMAQIYAYETARPQECERHETLLGSKETAELLAEAFRVVHVPAVSRISEAVESSSSPLDQIIDQMLWRKGLLKPEFIEFRERILREYCEIFPSDDPTDFQSAGKLINDAFQRFAPGSSVELTWKPSSTLKIMPPGYRAMVTEDGVAGDIERKGSGVQRALIVAILNATADHGSASVADGNDVKTGPTTLLLVEEPELYQHPTRARHFSRSLIDLVNTSNLPHSQVIVTTHSPYFVSIDTFASVRLLRRDRSKAEKSRRTPRRIISYTSLEAIWNKILSIKNIQKGTQGELVAKSRLKYSFDVNVREGFFADAVVLVEGLSDKAAVAAGFASRGKDLDALGIALIGERGVGELDKLWCIFEALDIPTFMIFDGDKGGENDESVRNSRLLTLVGASPDAYPATIVKEKYAVFESTREITLKHEFGADYDRLMTNACLALDYPRSQGEKTIGVVTDVYKELDRLGHSSSTLNAICEAIENLIA